MTDRKPDGTAGHPSGPDVLGVPAGAQVTLASFVDSRIGAAAVPLYVAGAVASDGATRWTMVGVSVLLAGLAVGGNRAVTRAHAIIGLVVSVALAVLWSWQLQHVPHLVTAGLLTSVVYNSLMTTRPIAEAGIVAVPLSYFVAQVVFGAGAHSVIQTLGVAAMMLMLSVMLFSVRLLAERKIAEHTHALHRANFRLDRLTRTDALTGLANRRELDHCLADTWRTAEAAGAPISVIMVDIDHFKAYNDHYGHQGGDDCLGRVAQALTAGIRDGDTAARYGGEEFSIILPDTGPEAAREVAERVRQCVADLRLEHQAAPGGLVTVSIGLASAAAGAGVSAQQLIRQADLGLYEAKRQGRDRIGSAPAARLTEGAPKDHAV